MLNPDYKDMLSRLLANTVDFILVGAYALAVPGTIFQIGVEPRRIDLITEIERDRLDAEKLKSVL